MFIPAQVTQADLSIELAGDSKTMLASRSQVVAFVAIILLFTGRARLASRVHDREISSGLRAFYKEISWKIGGKKISGYQGIR